MKYFNFKTLLLLLTFQGLCYATPQEDLFSSVITEPDSISQEYLQPEVYPEHLQDGNATNWNVNATEYNDSIFSKTHGGVAAGIQTLTKGPNRVLIGVQFHGFNQDRREGVSWRLFWVNFEMGLAQSEKNSSKVPAVNMTVTPFSRVSKEKGSQDETIQFNLNLLQTKYYRDVELDINHHLTIHALEFKMGFEKAASEHITPGTPGGFAEVAVNALGYTLASFYQSQQTTNFLHIAGVKLGLGMQVYLTKNSKIRWKVIGIEVNGGVQNVTVGANTELAYVLKSSFSQLSIFARAGVIATTIFRDDPDYTSDIDEHKDGPSYGTLIFGINMNW